MASIEDFKKLEFKVATIQDVKEHPDAERLYVMQVDVGGETREVVAGIKKRYTPEELKGQQCVVVTNLDPATIRGVQSNGMILAAKDEEEFAILAPARPLRPGACVS